MGKPRVDTLLVVVTPTAIIEDCTVHNQATAIVGVAVATKAVKAVPLSR